MPTLIQGLLKVFSPGKSGDESESDRNLKAMKKRSSLKLLLELFFVGVIEDGGIFINIIKDLTSVEQLKDREATQTSLTLLSSFARQGRIFLGLSVTGPEIHEEVFLLLIHCISLYYQCFLLIVFVPCPPFSLFFSTSSHFKSRLQVLLQPVFVVMIVLSAQNCAIYIPALTF